MSRRDRSHGFASKLLGGMIFEGGRMAAIEYGSYYWCVILNGNQADMRGETVYLHADEQSIDSHGSLVFKSAGRRPAGADPEQKDEQPKRDSGDKNMKNGNGRDMIYVAFAAGSWRLVYAAKLQDGASASIEHWSAADGSHVPLAAAPPNSGAAGYPVRE